MMEEPTDEQRAFAVAVAEVSKALYSADFTKAINHLVATADSILARVSLLEEQVADLAETSEHLAAHVCPGDDEGDVADADPDE